MQPSCEPHPRVTAALGGASAYRVWRHADLPDPITCPGDFALAIGVDVSRVAKTLLLARRGRSQPSPSVEDFAGATLAAPQRADLKRVAELLEWSACELASEEEALRLTGYPRWGVSPLGLTLRLVMSASLLVNETIFVGGGQTGVEIEIAPGTLASLGRATTANIDKAVSALS